MKNVLLGLFRVERKYQREMTIESPSIISKNNLRIDD